MVWPFSRKVKANESVKPDERQLRQLAKLVHELGYDLQPDGVAVGLAGLMSGYSLGEAASHTVVVGYANDVLRLKETSDLDKMMKLPAIGMALLEMLKELKDKRMMRVDIWTNDARAIGKMMAPGPEAIEWAEKVLRDPMVSGKNIATCRLL